MTLEELRELLTAVTQRPFGPIRPEQQLRDLGLESIDQVRIISRLERRLNRPIDEKTAMSIKTVADLLALSADGTEKPR
jgi:acyl carrier protein